MERRPAKDSEQKQEELWIVLSITNTDGGSLHLLEALKQEDSRWLSQKALDHQPI